MTDENSKLAEQVQEVFNRIVFASRDKDYARVASSFDELASLFNLKGRGLNLGLARTVGIPHYEMSRYRLQKVAPSASKLDVIAKNLSSTLEKRIMLPTDDMRPKTDEQIRASKTVLELLTDIVKDLSPQDSISIEQQGSEILINPRLSRGITSTKFNDILYLGQKHNMKNVTISPTEDGKGYSIRAFEIAQPK